VGTQHDVREMQRDVVTAVTYGGAESQRVVSVAGCCVCPSLKGTYQGEVCPVRRDICPVCPGDVCHGRTDIGRGIDVGRQRGISEERSGGQRGISEETARGYARNGICLEGRLGAAVSVY